MIKTVFSLIQTQRRGTPPSCKVVSSTTGMPCSERRRRTDSRRLRLLALPLAGFVTRTAESRKTESGDERKGMVSMARRDSRQERGASSMRPSCLKYLLTSILITSMQGGFASLPFAATPELLGRIERLRAKPSSEVKLLHFPLSRIIMPLGEKHLLALKRQFLEFQDSAKGIELFAFIQIMKQIVPHQPHEDFLLTQGLIKFFQLADYDDEGRLVWSEFTSFLCEEAITYLEASAGEDKTAVSKSLRRNYQLTLSGVDNTARVNPVIQIRYEAGKLFSLQSTSSHICQFSLSCEEIRSHISIRAPSEHVDLKEFAKADRSRLKARFKANESEYLLDFALHKDPQRYRNLMIGTTSHRRFFVWTRLKGSFKYWLNFPHRELHLKIEHLRQHDLWVTATAQHEIIVWRFTPQLFERMAKLAKEELRESIPQILKLTNEAEVTIFKSHKDIITSLVEIGQPLTLASGAMDCQIKIWDIERQKLVIPLTEGAEKNNCIAGLDYSECDKHFLISFGFRKYISVWCPFRSRTRAFVGRLQGHKDIVVACRFIRGSNFCVSLDKSSSIRIWEVGSLTSIYNFSRITPCIDNASIRTMLTVPEHNVVVLAGRKIFVYKDEDALVSSKSTGLELAPLDLIYLKVEKLFAVLYKDELRVHSATTGEAVSSHKFGLEHEQFTAMSAVSGGSNLLLADNRGNLILVHVGGMGVIMRLECESYFQNANIHIHTITLNRPARQIICAGTEHILVLEEMSSISIRLSKVITKIFGEARLTALVSLPSLKCMVAGSDSGLVYLWQTPLCTLHKGLQLLQERINALESLEQYPVLVAAQETSIALLDLRRVAVFARINVSVIINKVRRPVMPISLLAIKRTNTKTFIFSPEQRNFTNGVGTGQTVEGCQLLVGDNSGVVRLLYLQQLLKHYRIEKDRGRVEKERTKERQTESQILKREIVSLDRLKTNLEVSVERGVVLHEDYNTVKLGKVKLFKEGVLRVKAVSQELFAVFNENSIKLARLDGHVMGVLSIFEDLTSRFKWTYCPNLVEQRLKQIATTIEVLSHLSPTRLADSEKEAIFHRQLDLLEFGVPQPVESVREARLVKATSMQHQVDEELRVHHQAQIVQPTLKVQEVREVQQRKEDQVEAWLKSIQEQFKSKKQDTPNQKFVKEINKIILKSFNKPVVLAKHEAATDSEPSKSLNVKKEQVKDSQVEAEDFSARPAKSKKEVAPAKKQLRDLEKEGVKCLQKMIRLISPEQKQTEFEIASQRNPRRSVVKEAGLKTGNPVLKKVKSLLQYEAYRQSLVFQGESCKRQVSSNEILQQIAKMYHEQGVPKKRRLQSRGNNNRKGELFLSKMSERLKMRLFREECKPYDSAVLKGKRPASSC